MLWLSYSGVLAVWTVLLPRRSVTSLSCESGPVATDFLWLFIILRDCFGFPYFSHTHNSSIQSIAYTLDTQLTMSRPTSSLYCCLLTKLPVMLVMFYRHLRIHVSWHNVIVWKYDFITKPKVLKTDYCGIVADGVVISKLFCYLHNYSGNVPRTILRSNVSSLYNEADIVEAKNCLFTWINSAKLGFYDVPQNKPNKSYSQKLPHNTCIYRAELLAIKLALHYIRKYSIKTSVILLILSLLYNLFNHKNTPSNNCKYTYHHTLSTCKQFWCNFILDSHPCWYYW